MMFFSLTLLIFLVICHNTAADDNPNCNDAYSCMGTVIVDDSNNSASFLSCGGYKSCYEIQILATESDYASRRQSIQCSGSYSCYLGDRILAGGRTVISNTGEIICEGYHSCGKANLYAQSFIYCDGSFSCINSMLTYDILNTIKYSTYNELNNDNNPNNNVQISKSVLYCDGNSACAGASIYSMREIYGFGSFSLKFGTIYTNHSDLNISLHGYYAGYGLNIFCNYDSISNSDIGDDICYIDCHGNGCENTYIHCTDESSLCKGRPNGLCTNCYYKCGEYNSCPHICIDGECVKGRNTGNNQYINIWPRETDEDNYLWNKTEWLDTINIEKKYIELTTYDSLNCDNNNNNNNNSNSNSNNKAVLCDNYETSIYSNTSCYNNENITVSSNASICCRGYFSCPFGSGLITSARISEENSDLTNTYYARSNILCDGAESCGYEKLFNSNGDIFCSGHSACIVSTILGNDYKNGYTAIDIFDEKFENLILNKNYYNTVTRLYCDGDLSCFDTKVINMKDIGCDGIDSCFNMNVYNTENIWANAYQAFHFGEIVTLPYSNITFNFYARAEYAAVGTVIKCNGEANCNIYCTVDKSCFNITLYCDNEYVDNCYVECDHNNNIYDETECPKIIYNITKDVTTTTTTTTTTTRATTTTTEEVPPPPPSPSDTESENDETSEMPLSTNENTNTGGGGSIIETTEIMLNGSVNVPADNQPTKRRQLFENVIEFVALILIIIVVSILLLYIACYSKHKLNQKKNVQWHNVSGNEDADEADVDGDNDEAVENTPIKDDENDKHTTKTSETEMANHV